MGVALGYVPDEWHTAAYEHVVSTKKVGLFGRITMHLCTCGATTMHGLNDMWSQHVRMEEDYIKWMEETIRKRSKRSGNFWN